MATYGNVAMMANTDIVSSYGASSYPVNMGLVTTSSDGRAVSAGVDAVAVSPGSRETATRTAATSLDQPSITTREADLKAALEARARAVASRLPARVVTARVPTLLPPLRTEQDVYESARWVPASSKAPVVLGVLLLLAVGYALTR